MGSTLTLPWMRCLGLKMRFSDLREIQTAANMAGLGLEFLELRKNAERYLYLRNRVPSEVLGQVKSAAGCWIDAEDGEGILVLLTGEDADAAVDAARGSTPSVGVA